MSHVRFFLFAPLMCLLPAAFAQQDASAKSTIRVVATATVAARPDRAEIDIGVITQAEKPADAAAANARQLTAVLGALREAAGAAAEIQTLSYALTPVYRYATGAQPVLTGYTASNVVRVTLDDLEKVGSVVDAATRSGANRIQDIRFVLRDPESVRLEALRQAARKADSEADALASALGVRVLRVLSAEESGSAPMPVRRMMLAAPQARAAEEATPIEAGTLNVSADVTLTVEVGERRAAAP